MCGRYVSPEQAEFEREYNIRVRDPFQRVYNAAPSMQLPVIRWMEGERECSGMRWGLIPTWWSKPTAPTSTINARSEDAAAKPMWRSAVRHARCLVPALGWYEWQSAVKHAGADDDQRAPPARKQPFFIHASGLSGFCFAGLWSSWKSSEGAEQLTFAILTRDAAPQLAEIHNRMPVVVPAGAFDDWLNLAASDTSALLAQVVHASLTNFEFYPVSTYVNAPRNQGQRCIERVAL